MPTFMHDGIVCGMAAFKKHCAFGFWKGKLILDKQGKCIDESMGHFGHIASIKDLPSDRQLMAYIKKAVKLNMDGVKVLGRERRKATPKWVPACLLTALRKHPKALENFRALSAGHRNEYVIWITDAKREATRLKRLGIAVSWLKDGKNMNWCYETRGR